MRATVPARRKSRRFSSAQLRVAAQTSARLVQETSAAIDQLTELARFKDDMAILAVHDLKNPLSVILANYHYIREEVKTSSECLQALDDSRRAAERMQRLLSNLIDVTRLENPRFEVSRQASDVSNLFLNVVAERRGIASAQQISIDCDVLEVARPIIPLDHDLLTRAIENIMDNALRYTPTGGRIEVRLRELGDAIEARIGNNGAAIPKAARQSIFEKFRQADSLARPKERNAHMNLGLGLYFCRLAVEAHGGALWVEETERLPTVFVIRLPR